jgi:hypothetical protein
MASLSLHRLMASFYRGSTSLPGVIVAFAKKVARVLRPFVSFARDPYHSGRELLRIPDLLQAHEFVANWSPTNPASTDAAPKDVVANPLREYFENNKTGPGIWKWEHYFDIYHRHLAPFVRQPVRVVEVGIYSGGSLGMWRSYFGPGSHIIGVDIEPACRSYAGEGISIAIGDQADRKFWQYLRDEYGPIDVLIDDGGHTPEQQRITLEETLPFLRPGGVYICEDVEGIWQPFGAYALGLAGNMSAWRNIPADGKQGLHSSGVTDFQADIESISFYPFVIAIEKRRAAIDKLRCTRRGTEWQPFFDHV